MTDVTDVSPKQLKEHLELGGIRSNSSIATTSISDEEVYQELPANNTQLLTVFLIVSTMIGSGNTYSHLYMTNVILVPLIIIIYFPYRPFYALKVYSTCQWSSREQEFLVLL